MGHSYRKYGGLLGQDPPAGRRRATAAAADRGTARSEDYSVRAGTVGWAVVAVL